MRNDKPYKVTDIDTMRMEEDWGEQHPDSTQVTPDKISDPDSCYALAEDKNASQHIKLEVENTLKAMVIDKSKSVSF